MIQRIQTVYLALAILAISLLFFFPLSTFYNEQLGSYRFYLTGIKDMTHAGNEPFSSWFASPLIASAVLLAALAFYTILAFANRPKQIKTTNILVMLNILFVLGILFAYIPLIEKKTGIKSDFAGTLGIYLPIVSLMFLVLANRAIKRDEKLVRSSDRLR